MKTEVGQAAWFVPDIYPDTQGLQTRMSVAQTRFTKLECWSVKAALVRLHPRHMTAEISLKLKKTGCHNSRRLKSPNGIDSFNACDGLRKERERGRAGAGGEEVGLCREEKSRHNARGACVSQMHCIAAAAAAAPAALPMNDQLINDHPARRAARLSNGFLVWHWQQWQRPFSSYPTSDQ